jgi:hypothetical protein
VLNIERWAHPGRDVITPEPARRGGGAIGESSRRCQRCCRLSAAVLETRHATCDLRPATWSRSTACPCQTAHFFSHDAQPLPRGCRHLPKTLQRRKDDPECPIDSRGGSGLSSAGGATTLRSWPISTSPRHATPRNATHGVSPAELPHEHQHQLQRRHAHSCARRRLLERSTCSG